MRRGLHMGAFVASGRRLSHLGEGEVRFRFPAFLFIPASWVFLGSQVVIDQQGVM